MAEGGEAAGGASISVEQARQIVDEAKAACEANATQVEQAKQMAANASDISILMSTVLPPVASVLDNVLQKYGFQPGPLGVFNMLNSLQQFSSDQEVVSKATEIREKFIPEHLMPQVSQLLSSAAGNM